MSATNGTKKDEKAKAGPWRVRTRNRGFSSPHGHGPYQLRFVNGVAETDNEKAARHAAEECGYEVTDLGDGRIANPLPPTDEEKAAMAAADAERAEVAKKAAAAKK